MTCTIRLPDDKSRSPFVPVAAGATDRRRLRLDRLDRLGDRSRARAARPCRAADSCADPRKTTARSPGILRPRPLTPPGSPGVDAVINLAGESLAQRWSDSVKRRIRESRVKGTTTLARAIASLDPKPRALLSGSAMGIYGLRGDETLDESSTLGNDFLASVAQGLGGGNAARRRRGHSRREAANGTRDLARRRRAREDAPAVSPGSRRPAGKRKAVDELDRAHRLRRSGDVSPRQRFDRRTRSISSRRIR